uniref:Uncharacterized protein n=1 Tax=Arundo donax TaxID=35708 RepID=A0A0A9ACB3_ARUDO
MERPCSRHSFARRWSSWSHWPWQTKKSKWAPVIGEVIVTMYKQKVVFDDLGRCVKMKAGPCLGTRQAAPSK